jgi:site-specific DNA recombinase
MPNPKAPTAALYLRSSKDRSDVSIEAQRHALKPFAAELGLTIVAEYVDVVESGKDEDRPGFLRLYEDLRSRGRAWNNVLALDTSRISRRRRISIYFEEMECARRGVKVIYKSLQGTDPETEILLKSVLQGVDEWHSLVSKRKALGGMAANVRRGFRAGGRAPIGYKLHHIDTGAVRDGRPVLKSRLELDPELAPKVQTYLRARAAGVRRALALRQAELAIAESSLVGVEWNALTYAGITVWNVHQEREQGAYVGGSKRRPRSEWQMKRDTHPALISEEEAEQIIASLEDWTETRSRQKDSDYLLAGLLRTGAGAAWSGHKAGRYYRLGNRTVPAADVEETVLEAVRRDLRSREFARVIVERLRANAGREHVAEAAKLTQAAAAIDGRISRFMDMIEQLETPGPVLRKVEELEREQTRLRREAEALAREAQAARAARAITEDQVLRQFDTMAEELVRDDRDRVRDFLARTLTGVTLEPGSDELALNWRIRLGGRNAPPGPSGPGVLRWRPHGDATLIHPTELRTYARLKKAA